MNLVKWNPWREMETFSDRINRLLDDSPLPGVWRNDVSNATKWKPVVDVYDKDDKIVIKAELPGVDKENLHVDLKDNTLTLEGERSRENEVKGDTYYCRERFQGKFRRSFRVPAGLEADRIKADYKDGVLNIEILKPEEAKTKKIAVH